MAFLLTQCAMELYPSKWFIPHDKLMLEDDLGSGAFGMVKKAKVYRLSEEEEFTTVAVKMLKGFSTSIFKVTELCCIPFVSLTF